VAGEIRCNGYVAASKKSSDTSAAAQNN